MAAICLHTERLVLREWRVEDQPAFADMNADPAVMAHFPSTLDRTASDALLDRLRDDLTRDGWGLWAVARRDDGTMLGFTGLSRLDFQAPFTPAIEVGWRLRRAAWGHGYATEAARAAVTYGFDLLGLAQIVSITVPANTRSRGVMERLGMRRDPDEDFDHPRLPPGHRLRRHVLYRLDRDAWHNARRGTSASEEPAPD
jgi:RimJ/RimL family protein N-acetyltransferase